MLRCCKSSVQQRGMWSIVCQSIYRIYLFRYPEILSEEWVGRALSFLPVERRERLLRYRRMIDRKNYWGCGGLRGLPNERLSRALRMMRGVPFLATLCSFLAYPHTLPASHSPVRLLFPYNPW